MKIDVSNDIENVFDYLKADFDSTARFMNFIYNIKVRSYLDVDVPVNENDTLLTLSTCSYETDNMRTIVVARKLREKEDVSEYIKTAKTSSPVSSASSSFWIEYKAGNTPWYDGEGKLEGDETVEYMAQSKMFTVQFLDAKGKAFATQIVLEGRDAKAPKEPPRKASDGKYYYVFKGWDTDFTNVTKDLMVKPVFTQKKLQVATKPTTKPTTVPPETEAPYEPPVDDEPIVTEAPETQPPQTQAPSTQPPTTVPATEATEAPTTAAPATTVPEIIETQPQTNASVASVTE